MFLFKYFFLLLALWSLVYVQIGMAGEKSTKTEFQQRLLSPKSTADSWFGEDKFKHLMASALIVGLSYNIARYDFHNPKPNAVMLGCGISISAGITKEIWDLYRPGGIPSYRDLIADIVGVAVGVFLMTETVRW